MTCSDPADCYDKNAEAFYKVTGMLAPGKDDASMSHAYEQREEAWKKWKSNFKCYYPTS